MQLLFCIPYFFGSIAKLNNDWLFRAQPLKLWFSQRRGEIYHYWFLPWFVAWAGVIYDFIVYYNIVFYLNVIDFMFRYHFYCIGNQQGTLLLFQLLWHSISQINTCNNYHQVTLCLISNNYVFCAISGSTLVSFHWP